MKDKRENTDIIGASSRLQEQMIVDRKKVGEIKAQLEAVLESYDANATDLEQIVEQSRKQAKLHVVDEEEIGFSQAVQGSKGTGLQQSHRMMTLRQFRINKGIKLRELHDELDIPFPHLSEIERGNRLMSIAQRDKYEKWLGSRIEYRLVPYVELSEEE